MPEPISRAQSDFALGRMGYEVVDHEAGLVRYRDTQYPGIPEHLLHFDFRNGPIPWDDYRRQLEYEGVNVSVFLAELEF